MRYCFIFILLVLFAFSTSAQEESEISLPFVYATMSEADYTNDFYLMDALTGTIHQEFTQTGNDCPIRFSENGRWLAYWQAEETYTDNFLHDRETDTTRYLASGIIQNLIWSSDDRFMATNQHYTTATNSVNKITVYHTGSLDILFEDNLDTEVYIQQTTMQFVGEELLYATVNSETATLELYHWDGKDVERETLEDEIFTSWSRLYFSPNGRYLAGYSQDEIYLLDLETKTITLIGTHHGEDTIQWLGNQGASLGYIAEDSSENFYLAEYNLLEESTEPEQLIEAEHSFSLSPDAANLVYRVLDTENESLSLLLLNRSDNISSEIAQIQFWHGELQWLSASQFVYLYAEPSTENFADIFFYDINTGENRQLTDTPELREGFECFLG